MSQPEIDNITQTKYIKTYGVLFSTYYRGALECSHPYLGFFICRRHPLNNPSVYTEFPIYLLSQVHHLQARLHVALNLPS